MRPIATTPLSVPVICPARDPFMRPPRESSGHWLRLAGTTGTDRRGAARAHRDQRGGGAVRVNTPGMLNAGPQGLPVAAAIRGALTHRNRDGPRPSGGPAPGGRAAPFRPAVRARELRGGAVFPPHRGQRHRVLAILPGYEP